MRCHCYDGWMRRQDDGTYLCDGCGDRGIRSDESGDVLTTQGCVRLSGAGCWAYSDDAEPIGSWFNIRSVRHMAALEHFDKTKTWPEGFMPEKVYCTEGWRRRLAQHMAAAWMRMILQYRPSESA